MLERVEKYSEGFSENCEIMVKELSKTPYLGDLVAQQFRELLRQANAESNMVVSTQLLALLQRDIAAFTIGISVFEDRGMKIPELTDEERRQLRTGKKYYEVWITKSGMKDEFDKSIYIKEANDYLDVKRVPRQGPDIGVTIARTLQEVFEILGLEL